MPKTTKLSIKTLLGSNQQRLAWKRVKRRNSLIITIRKCDNSVYVFVLQCLLYRLETFYQYVQKSCRDDVSIMLKNNIYCKSATLTWHHNIKPSFVFLSFCFFVFLSKFKMITHSLTDQPRSDISSQQRGQLKRKLKMGKAWTRTSNKRKIKQPNLRSQKDRTSNVWEGGSKKQDGESGHLCQWVSGAGKQVNTIGTFSFRPHCFSFTPPCLHQNVHCAQVCNALYTMQRVDCNAVREERKVSNAS